MLNVMAEAQGESIVSAGSLTVISSSRMELGAPTNAAKCRSNTYVTQNMILCRLDEAPPILVADTCLCMPSRVDIRRA